MWLTENTRHYLLSCKSYQLSRTTMFNTISPIIRSQLGKELTTVTRSMMISIMLYCSEDIDYNHNTQILKAVTTFIKTTKRLDSQ